MPQHETSSDASATLAELGASWGWMLFFGIVTLIAGILVVAWPGETVVVIAVLFGIQLFIGGIFRVVTAFADAGEHHRVANVLVGMLAIVIGILCLRNVFQTIAVLVLLLGIFWVVSGVMDIVVGLASKTHPHRGMTVLTGALGFIAGLIVLTYPTVTVVALAWILGIWLIVYGILEIAASMKVKKLQGAMASAM